MKIKYIIMSAVAALTLSLSACSDFLDQTPYAFPIEENFWKTAEQAEGGVNGTYSLLRYALGQNSRYNVYGDVTGTGIFSSALFTNWTYAAKMQLEKGTGTITFRTWREFYQVVDQCNRAIKHLNENLTDADFEVAGRREVLIGELYFLRAYTYYTMYKIWGGVPLVTEVPSTTVGAQYLPRAQESEVAELIYGDLYDAISRLDWNYATSTNAAHDKSIRANKAVAYATLAHMAAWDGDYVKCVAACDSIIASGQYSLETTENIAKLTSNSSDEFIFQQFYGSKDEATSPMATGSQSEGQFYHALMCYPYWGSTAWGSSTAEPGLTLDGPMIRTMFPESDDDARYNTFFGLTPAGDIMCHKFNNFEEDANDELYCLNNRVIFRLADIYLLRAEANAQLGNVSEAITDLDLIRNRAGLKNYDGKSSLSRAIMDERGRELFLEGHRYYDLCRYYFETGISMLTNTSASQMSQGKYFWPVDPSLFENNIVTLQNTYWQGKL